MEHWLDRIDAAAAEALRQQKLRQREQASARMMQALLDVAGVLTPARSARRCRRPAMLRGLGSLAMTRLLLIDDDTRLAAMVADDLRAATAAAR